MIAYMVETLGIKSDAANTLRGDYWRNHGTTLAGLMTHHGIDPDPFLLAVHDVTLDHLEPDPLLAAHIRALPGRKIVYTNGSAPYAERVLAARGLSGLFEGIYGVEHANYRPKPERSAFERVFALADVDTTCAAMFEDDPRNLAAPHAMGMRTVHVAPEAHQGDHIHHHTVDLTEFLGQLR